MKALSLTAFVLTFLIIAVYLLVPTDRKYLKSHEWAKVEGEVATIGITDHAQQALGDIVFAELPEIGDEVVAGDKSATVESVKAASDIYSPISGEVVGINEEVKNAPDIINKGAYEEGWMFKVKIADPAQVEGLLDSESYQGVLEEEG